jgi:hypothetical protein
METGAVGMNYWAILVAAVVYTALGALWYSPALFGNAWMKNIGKTKEQVAADFSFMSIIWGLVMAFIACYGIARIMTWTKVISVGNGIMVGLLAGVCFVLTTFWINDSFEHRPPNLTIMNILYHLVGFVIAGIIIGLWR